MASKEEPRGVYAGDTFRNLLLQYSKDRLPIDRKYRRDFIKAQKAKRARRKAAQAAKNEGAK